MADGVILVPIFTRSLSIWCSLFFSLFFFPSVFFFFCFFFFFFGSFFVGVGGGVLVRQ